MADPVVSRPKRQRRGDAAQVAPLGMRILALMGVAVVCLVIPILGLMGKLSFEGPPLASGELPLSDKEAVLAFTLEQRASVSISVRLPEGVRREAVVTLMRPSPWHESWSVGEDGRSLKRRVVEGERPGQGPLGSYGLAYEPDLERARRIPARKNSYTSFVFEPGTWFIRLEPGEGDQRGEDGHATVEVRVDEVNPRLPR